MFYKKNVGGWERTLRIMMGAMMLGSGLYWLHGQMLGYMLAAMGLMAAVTGFVGYCPVCSIAGRVPVQK